MIHSIKCAINTCGGRHYLCLHGLTWEQQILGSNLQSPGQLLSDLLMLEGGLNEVLQNSFKAGASVVTVKGRLADPAL